MVEIVSRSLKVKNGILSVLYNQETDVDGYPPVFGVPGNFQPERYMKARKRPSM